MGARIAAFCCGVIILYSGQMAPEPLALVAAVSVLVLVMFRWRRGPGAFCDFALALALGLLVSSATVSWQRLGTLPPGLEGEPVEVSGYLCEVPSPGAFGSVRFSLCVTAWHLPPALATAHRLPQRLRLTASGQQGSLDIPSPMRATLVLKRPHGAVNPGGFRYETWLFRQQIGATGTVRQLVAEQAACGPECRYHRSRAGLVRSLENRLANINNRSLGLSLMVGYRGGLSSGDWSVLQATGTVHLVAISGLHLGLVAAMVAWLARWVLRVPPVSGWPSGRQRLLALTLVLAASLIYALLAGFTVPTRRALVMVAVASWVVFRGTLLSPWQAWLVAMGLVLLMDPLSVLDQGFWLSFSAVAVLVLVFSRRLRTVSPLASLPLAQIAVFAGLWPVLTAMDLPAALAGLPANLLAIPWLTFVVMPLIVLSGVALMIPGAPELLLPLLDMSLGALWHLLRWLAALELPAPGLPLTAVTGLAALVLLALWWPDRRYRRYLLGVSLLVLVIVMVERPRSNPWQSEPELRVWDVGQGLAVMIRHQDQVLLYDTGPESPSGYNAVESVLLPSLAVLGIRSLDYLVVSHGDRDHAGAIPALLARYPVPDRVSGEPERLLTLFPELAASDDGQGGPAFRGCETGRSWTVGEVNIRLWQLDTVGLDWRPDGNDLSCVVLASYQGVQVVLPGDISRRVERRLLPWLGQHARPSDHWLVVAPHHGSKTSSGPEFVNALAPHWVVFTAGYRHRYGHPHPDVVERYQAAGTALLNTASSGSLRIQLHGVTDSGHPSVTIEGARDRAPFWIRSSEPVVE